jgi:hypothetical protein
MIECLAVGQLERPPGFAGSPLTVLQPEEPGA